VRLSAGMPGEAQRTGQVVLVVGGERLPLEFTVPARPVTVEQLLPILRGLSSLFSARGAVRSEAAGRPISCRVGCGACCRQLVPLSPSEAGALARLVDALPEPRRGQIRGRFEEALQKLDAAGLLGRMGTRTPAERTELGRAYSGRASPAPSSRTNPALSIPTGRWPAASTSSPRRPRTAARPGPTIPTSWRCDAYVLPTLVEVEAGGWTPLLLALRFRDENPEPVPSGEAPAILREVIGRLVTEA